MTTAEWLDGWMHELNYIYRRWCEFMRVFVCNFGKQVKCIDALVCHTHTHTHKWAEFSRANSNTGVVTRNCVQCLNEIDVLHTAVALVRRLTITISLDFLVYLSHCVCSHHMLFFAFSSFHCCRLVFKETFLSFILFLNCDCILHVSLFHVCTCHGK